MCRVTAGAEDATGDCGVGQSTAAPLHSFLFCNALTEPHDRFIPTSGMVQMVVISMRALLGDVTTTLLAPAEVRHLGWLIKGM